MKTRRILAKRQISTCLAFWAVICLSSSTFGRTLRNSILYVTQVPVTKKVNSVVSVGGSHLGDTYSAPRGGDLMIRYRDGEVKNLTREAGYGQVGRYQNTPQAIAVRDPEVHWSGQRALFSMVVGSPADASDDRQFYWQIYEITGLGSNDTPVIERVPGQAENFNNIQPAYTSSDDEIVFVSDSTLDQSRKLFPVRDEQGGGHAVTGLWQLNRVSQTTRLLEHSPSGSFNPFVDSFGRIVFSRWDHLQRDEDVDRRRAFDYSSESAEADRRPWRDVFPEPYVYTGTTEGHRFDLFLPWTINQDGTDLLTMNHLGRHELVTSAKRSFADANLRDFEAKLNQNLFFGSGSETRAASYLHLSERWDERGTYVATDAVSNAVSAGRLVKFSAAPETNPNDVSVRVVSNRGLARDPRYLADGSLMGSVSSSPAPRAIHSTYGGKGLITTEEAEVDPTEIPPSDEPFKIRVTDPGRGDLGDVPVVMSKFNKVFRTNVSAEGEETFFGELWELQPVEVVAREVPNVGSPALPDLETQVFEESGVSLAAMKRWLTKNDLALLVSRNVTARDANDEQQPYNLFVPGGVESIKDQGPKYGITNLQFFQGDYVRGYLNDSGQYDAQAGRRVTARVLHDDKGFNLPSDIPGSAEIAPDGSTAMLVPARRALSWQTTDAHGEPVVRERYWLSFQAGEIRTCTACHGVNERDQLGRRELTNPPQALERLLGHWKEQYPGANRTLGEEAYDAWAQANELTTSMHEDSDGDGLSELEEFLYGDHPGVPVAKDAAVHPLQGRFEKGDDGKVRLRLSFTLQMASPVPVALESSHNLKTWRGEWAHDGIKGEASSPRFEVVRSTEEVGEGLQMIKLVGRPALKDGQQRYYRLRFTD